MSYERSHLEIWATAIEAIIREAAQLIRNAHDPGATAMAKSSARDLVTQYDIKVQSYLEPRLRALIPRAGFLGEEVGAVDIEGRDLYFVVDPIDGTSNFIANARHSAISVALISARPTPHPILGLCYNPYLDEMFVALHRHGATLNGERLAAPTRALHDGLVLFGTSPYDRTQADATFLLLRALFDECRDIRRSGSAVLDICYVAAGRADLFYERTLSPWDYAAAALVARESGCEVTDFEGGDPDYTGPSGIVVGVPEHAGYVRDLAGRLYG